MKLNDVINNARNKIKDNLSLLNWFEYVLKNTNIYLDKTFGIFEGDYTIGGEGVNEFRSLCHSNSYFLRDKTDRKNIPCITLFNKNETLNSMTWVLLHEMGHSFFMYQQETLGFDLTMGLLFQFKPTKGLDNNQAHEEQPQEIISNLIANTIMGKCYDRMWWVENRK